MWTLFEAISVDLNVKRAFRVARLVNQEKETKRLIDYIGLDWHEACLSPQDNKRGVSTASSIQVRQKVYQGSSQKWRKYEPFLNGAFDQISWLWQHQKLLTDQTTIELTLLIENMVFKL